MALRDFETFMRERLLVFNANLDVSPGSPIDVQVIQPTLRRLGTDPFTVDLGTFLTDRLRQELPDLAISQGDAVTDLLVKPAILLWDPIVRELQRIKQSLSLRDPATLTMDEASALGANVFATMRFGEVARGPARIYFAAPQRMTISPDNFLTSRTGLHFYPNLVQSISATEMQLNKEGSLYFFDVNVVAEQPGDAYNIEPKELVSIANVAAAVRVTNRVRFRFGIPAEDPTTFIGRVDQDLGERSMVSQRGIVSRLVRNFSDLTRVGVIGANDPEMQRDILVGGGLGSIVDTGTATGHGAGMNAVVVPDGEAKPRSRRLQILDPIDLFELVGPAQIAVSGFVLTLFDAFGPANPPIVRDLRVAKIVTSNTLDLEEQVLAYPSPFEANKAWTLRRNSLTLSSIPGGILFPDGPNGTLELPENSVHVGGSMDIYARTVAFDQSSLTIESVTDDEPILAGIAAIVSSTTEVEVTDFILGTNYSSGGIEWQQFEAAVRLGWTFQVDNGPAAGAYRVIGVTQVNGASPVFTLSQAVPGPLVDGYRWRLFDELDIDLTSPQQTKVTGSNLQTTQNSSTITTGTSTNFDAYGVADGDYLIISNGQDAGEYKIIGAPIPPFYTSLTIDHVCSFTSTNLKYRIVQKNSGGGVRRPFIRIRDIELLDTTQQPVGSKVPYAKPVDGRTTSFANVSRGVKGIYRDVSLGIVSQYFSGAIPFLGGQTLTITWDGIVGGPLSISVGGPQTVTQLVAALNLISPGYGTGRIAIDLGGYLGIIPPGPNTRVIGALSTGMLALFGDTQDRTSGDIRSATAVAAGGWAAVSPAISKENLDVFEVVDGVQIGAYGQLNYGTAASAPLHTTEYDFGPELNRFGRVGARSLGSVRLYFLEPTSMEVDQNSVFAVDNINETLEYFPDPTLQAQLIPGLPNGVKPKDLLGTTGALTITSASAAFVQKGIRPGDILSIDYQPITGTVALLDPVPALALKTIILSVAGSPDTPIVFINDVLTPGAVSRDSVAAQINSAVGLTICRIVTVGPSKVLEFEADVAVTIRAVGSNAIPYILQTPAPTADLSNEAGLYGTYEIAAVGTTTLTLTTPLEGTPVTTYTRQQYKVFRPGTQRISSTQMSQQPAEVGLYYWDVELVSRGTGDLWNVTSGLKAVPDRYKSDGYYLTTNDQNLTFSEQEPVRLHISRTILQVGADDDPLNYTQLSGQNIQVNYDYSSVIGSVQSFASSDSERVVCANPLARHLLPHFVRMDVNYVGGSAPATIQPDIERYITERLPEDALESSDVQKILSDSGATSITNPIDILAVVYGINRTVVVERSQNALTTGRLHAFIPDRVNLTRRIV